MFSIDDVSHDPCTDHARAGDRTMPPSGSACPPDFTFCAVCARAYTLDMPRRPLVIPCGHTVCEDCVASLRADECPFDRLPFDRHFVSVNFSLVDALVYVQQQPCSAPINDEVPFSHYRACTGNNSAADLQAFAECFRKGLADGLTSSQSKARAFAVEKVIPSAKSARDFAVTRIFPSLRSTGQSVVNFAVDTVMPAVRDLPARIERTLGAGNNVSPPEVVDT